MPKFLNGKKCDDSAGTETSFSLPVSDLSLLSRKCQPVGLLGSGSVLAEFLPRFPSQIWVSDVTFVTFFRDKKCDALHLSHFLEECDALAHENVLYRFHLMFPEI